MGSSGEDLQEQKGKCSTYFEGSDRGENSRRKEHRTLEKKNFVTQKRL